MAVIFVAILLLISGSTSSVHAQTVTHADIATQKRAATLSLIDTLHEHVLLLQMLLVKKLEVRVAELEVLVANQ